MNYIERILAENISAFTPQNVVRELLNTNQIYSRYNQELIMYLNAIEDLLLDLNEIYKTVYYRCMARQGGSEFFTKYGYVMIKVAKQIFSVKTQWYVYQKRYQSFLNKLKSNTSQFIIFTNLKNLS